MKPTAAEVAEEEVVEGEVEGVAFVVTVVVSEVTEVVTSEAMIPEVVVAILGAVDFAVIVTREVQVASNVGKMATERSNVPTEVVAEVEAEADDGEGVLLLESLLAHDARQFDNHERENLVILCLYPIN